MSCYQVGALGAMPTLPDQHGSARSALWTAASGRYFICQQGRATCPPTSEMIPMEQFSGSCTFPEMSNEKHKARSLVFQEGFQEFKWLEDALEFAGISISEQLVSAINENSVVVICDNDGDPPEDFIQISRNVPHAHRIPFAGAGIALSQTLGVRHPIFVMDMGPLLFMLVTQASKLEAFLKRQYRATVSLRTPPPDKRARWVVTVAEDGTVFHSAMLIGPQPGVGQA